MRVQRIVAGVASALMVVSGMSLALAPSASAATEQFYGTITESSTNIQDGYFTGGCNWGTYGNPIQSASHPFTVARSAEYTFVGTSVPSSEVYMGVFQDSYSAGTCVASEANSLTTTLAPGNYLFVVWLCNSNCHTDFLGTYSINGGGPVGEAPIPPWVQAVGRGSNAACEAGWDPSWQEWAVPVTGGWVCTRSIPSLG